MSNELKHYGILGMRWGHRRGSNSDSGSSSKPKKKVNLDKVKEAAGTSSGIAKEAGNINRSISDIRNTRKREDLSKLSDSELQARVKRLNLEQQYSNLNTGQISNGQMYAKSVLEIAGSALAITSSAVAIAVAMKQLKG